MFGFTPVSAARRSRVCRFKLRGAVADDVSMGRFRNLARRGALCLLGASALMLGYAGNAYATVAPGGISTSWDPATRTITQVYPRPGYEGWPGPRVLVDASPYSSVFCPECPATWADVDRLDIHFPQRFTLYVTPWIFENAATQVHVHAPPTAGEPDTLVGVALDQNEVPPERWRQSYEIAYVGKTVDFGMDGRADVIVHAEDWSAPRSALGAGSDVLDLRRMTNIDYPKTRRGESAFPLGGCDCGSGDDRYYGHARLGKSAIILGSGNDLAWVVTKGGSHVNGGPGNDVVHGGPGPDVIYGGDTLPGGVDILFGHGGNDTLAKYGSGRAILNGGPGTDYLSGGLGPDVLIGGGNLGEGRGYDALRGAGGNDLYIGSNGVDHVLDKLGSTTAVLKGGRDSVVIDPKRRHRINCGAGNNDWVSHRVVGAIGCERWGWGPEGYRRLGRPR